MAKTFLVLSVLPTFLLLACDDCPKGLTKKFNPDKTWQCVDAVAEERERMAVEERRRREEVDRKAEAERKAADGRSTDLDVRIRTKVAHNFECQKPDAKCAPEPLSQDELQEFGHWKAQERRKVRPRAIRGEELTEFERSLLRD